MIQLLICLGKWLEQRFPKQVVVLETDYKALLAKIDIFENRLKDVAHIDARLAFVEKSAVHLEPVKLLAEEMAKMKAEMVSLRAGLGITASATSPEALETMLNGEYIHKGDHNG